MCLLKSWQILRKHIALKFLADCYLKSEKFLASSKLKELGRQQSANSLQLQNSESMGKLQYNYNKR